jgi:hypothetical protein
MRNFPAVSMYGRIVDVGVETQVGPALRTPQSPFHYEMSLFFEQK